MKLLFWVCFALVGYTYVGYAALLWLHVRLRQQSIVRAPISPSVSIIIAARNEEANLPAKLENLSRLDYPKHQLQVIVASDGSTDRTADILQGHEPAVLPVILSESHGKASALNEAVKRATGEILVFLDTRQVVDPDAVAELVSCFADSEVGAVSGELLLAGNSSSSSQDGLGIYWRIEKTVRKLESASGSVVGVTGAIYAIRRELYPEIPQGTILDDVFVPMQIALGGKRIVFQPSAIARDRILVEKGKEFSRKVRTLTGNYQLLRLAPWLLSPTNPLLFRFVSHKLLRLFVPISLVLLFLSAGLAGGRLYLALFWVQLILYGFAILGALSPTSKKLKPVGIANTFVMLNVAAAVAFYNFMTGKDNVWS